MEALEAILTRRSVRKYTDEPVAEETVKKLLEAAVSAPSAGNQQSWQFVIIDDRELLDKIPNVHPYSKMLQQAPLAIMVCGDMQRDSHKGYWVQDCSAATQNILLAARALGLGAVWLGCYPNEGRVKGLREMFGLPEHIVPLALLSIGHPAVEQGPVDRYDEARVHHNGW